VLFCVMCVICVLCLIVIPLPPGKNTLIAKINIHRKLRSHIEPKRQEIFVSLTLRHLPGDSNIYNH
jgi:hypothetical protein